MTAPSARLAGNGDSSSSTAEHFRLTGPTLPLDPLLHAFRRDLADIALAGRVIAPHYARPVTRACGAHPTALRSVASQDAPVLSELLPGELFAVLEYAGGWAWGSCPSDGLVGYVEAIELSEPLSPTHIVCERCAPVSADDDIASPVLASLPMGALLHGTEQGACLGTEYGCVSLSHLRRTAEPEDDPALVAERLIGSPYRPGGRTWHGIDGPGLLQLALLVCGIDAPRLPGQQRGLGAALADGVRLRRNDLVLWGETAGLMIDDLMMIHASASAEKVTVEPVAVAAGAAFERRRLTL